MSSLTDPTARRAQQALPPQMLEATVQEPPLTSDGFLRVQVDAQRGRVRECPWQPRFAVDDGELVEVEPKAGDAALVCESDEGNVWAVCWWPQ